MRDSLNPISFTYSFWVCCGATTMCDGIFSSLQMLSSQDDINTNISVLSFRFVKFQLLWAETFLPSANNSFSSKWQRYGRLFPFSRHIYMWNIEKVECNNNNKNNSLEGHYISQGNWTNQTKRANRYWLLLVYKRVKRQKQTTRKCKKSIKIRMSVREACQYQ